MVLFGVQLSSQDMQRIFTTASMCLKDHEAEHFFVQEHKQDGPLVETDPVWKSAKEAKKSDAMVCYAPLWKSLRIAQLSSVQVCVEEAVHEHAGAAFIRWVKEEEAKLRNKAVDVDAKGGSPEYDGRSVGSGVSGGTSVTDIRQSRSRGKRVYAPKPPAKLATEPGRHTLTDPACALQGIAARWLSAHYKTIARSIARAMARGLGFVTPCPPCVRAMVHFFHSARKFSKI